MTNLPKLIPLAFTLLLAGCYSTQNAPLVFFQAHTLGISATASGAQAAPELTLGYRDIDVALVPVQDSAGRPIRSVQSGVYSDALSVLGQFDVNTGAGTAVNVGLGKFFATGSAARVLAQGFAHKLEK
jgi:hypothetical protein